MFSFFGKKKSSPEDSPDESPIPGPQSEDDFVLIQGRNDPSGNSGSLYPQFGQGGTVNYPSRPAPPVKQKPIHYLQDVPFVLSKELAASTNKDTIAVQISSVMAYVTRKLHIEEMDYDFSMEKSVALE